MATATPSATAADPLAKEAALIAALGRLETAMVAFSGGVDSSYLLAMAHTTLGTAVTAVTADSPSLARTSLAEAEAFCRARGIRHLVVPTDEFEHEEYLANDGRRCYHCKAALLRAMNGLARATAGQRGGRVALLLGAIADDLGDHRPGMQAAAEAGAQWPLADLGFSKEDVRTRSRALGLASWDRPAEPCLSSRVPYGERVTVPGLRMIEDAERTLKELGFPECRARHHQVGGPAHGGKQAYLCRIEVPDADLARLVALRREVVPALRALGYRSVTLDLAGLASGGFNSLLAPPSA
jgi:uncharacterized protein